MLSSLRRKLLVLLLTCLFVIWVTVICKIYTDTKQEVSELFDAHLAQSAKVLLYLVADELYEERDNEEIENEEIKDKNKQKSVPIQEIEQHLEKHKYEKLLAFQITVDRLHFNFKSAKSPEVPLSGKQNGFSTKTIDKTRWRVFTLSDPDNIIFIRVGEPVSVRTELLGKIALNLILPILIAFPILAFLIWKIIGHTLLPLNQLAIKIKNRDPYQLSRIDSDISIPDEVKPLLDALNHLLDRLDKTLENERRFTADAAHELRTPLAGIKTQAQLAMRTDDASTRIEAMHQIVRSIDRCTHMSEQLLAMARLEADFTLDEQGSTRLDEIIKGVVDDLHDLADRKQIKIDTILPEKCCVHGNSQMVDIMLRNIIDNAIRYTDENGEILITLHDTREGISLVIEDNGPGIDENSLKQAFTRFNRFHRGNEKGSGLGLSIVKRIADLHGADISMGRSGMGGLKVDVIFRAVPPN